MEDTNLFDYEYTMPETPESNRLVINMDAPDASGGACPDSEPTTVTACNSLPSFEMFSRAPSMSSTSCWYSIPSTGENLVPDVSEAVHTESANQIIETSGSRQYNGSGEKQESVDRSFLMDTILGLEQHCYNPRHSTPAKNATDTFAHQTAVTESSQNFNGMQTLNIESLKQSKIAKTSGNVHVYKRQADKPPYSYVAMVIVAILNSKEKELTLAGIREKLMDMFPFFRSEYTGWKNSIRHALSNSKCFYKVEKRDDLDTTCVNVWKVDASFVKPHHTFNRYSKGLNYDSYKLTLQEELGLPPYDYTAEMDPLGNDNIQLPPTPCFQGDSVSAPDDFLNARNDSVPTPQSTISDLDSVSSSVMDVKPSRKRKRSEDFHSTQQTTYANKRKYLTTEYQHPHYGNQQCTEGVRPYDPYFSYYSTNFPSGQQWSSDMYQYGYPQQTFTSVQTSNLNSNNYDQLKHWWFNQAYYHAFAPSSFQSASYSDNTNWFPSSALDLTKNGQEK